MKLIQEGIDLVKQFEGCQLNAYRDIRGIWTIGYGHTGKDVQPGDYWSQEQADLNLADTLQHVAAAILPRINIEANDYEFSACVCLAYNIGVHAFLSSTLGTLMREGRFRDAANEFPKWDRAAGQEVPGLLRRRMAEKALFLTSV